MERIKKNENMGDYMEKYVRLIFFTIISCIIAIIIAFLPNYTKKTEEIEKFSYINILNEDTHYWGYGIVTKDDILCDKISIYFEKPLVEDIPIHIYYSNEEGLTEENSLWTSLKQGKMLECIDLPNSKYRELRLDIVGNCFINKVVIEQYDKYENVYYFLSFCFLIISFTFGIKLIITYHEMRQWLYNNLKAIFIFIIIAIISLSYITNVWYEIDDMTISSYHLETNYYTQELKDNNKYYFNIDIHDSKLIWLNFWADILEGNGEIKWSLLENQNCISTGQLTNDNYNQGQFKIELNVDTIKDSGFYQLQLEPLNTTSLQIYVDENNYLKATYYYLFQYNNTLKYMLVILDILRMGVVILLLSRLNICIKYWIMAVSMGILSIIIVIPYSTADEFRHFARAYSVANGQFVCEYNEQKEPYTYIPTNLYNLRYIAPENSISISDETNFNANLSRWLYYLKCDNTSENVSAWIGGVSDKGIFEYLPQVIAMWGGMILGVKQIWLFYFARIGNWLAITLIWYIAIRIVPKHKYLFIVLYCMPTNIVYACTSSTDGLLNAFIMLIMSIAIRRYYDNIELTNKKILISIIPIITYIAIIKLPYLLVAFLLVALDVNTKNLRNNWKIIIKNIIIVTVVCIGSYLLAVFLKGLYEPNININDSGNVEHLKYALEHIYEVIHILVQAFMGIMDETYCQAIYINSFCISILVLPYSLLMLYSATIEENKKVINTLQITIMILICSFIWGSILIVAYFWTNIGNPYIWGIQGRYICSIIMIGTVILALRSQNHNKIKEGRYIMAYCMAIMMVAFFKIIQIQWI